MIRRILATAALIALAAIAGCKEEEGCSSSEEFTLSSESAQFDGNTLSFGAEKQAATVEVTSESGSGKWKIRASLEDVWCTFSTKGGVLMVAVEQNNTDELRTSWVDVEMDGSTQRIAIRQEYLRRLSFVTREPEEILAAEAMDISLPLSTNIASENLSVSVSPADCDWITNLQVSAAAVTFTTLANETAFGRPATLTVEGDGLIASLDLLQFQSAEAGYPYRIDLSDAKFEEAEKAEDKCYIYEIWDEQNNVKIGELCKEFLYKKEAGSDAVVRKQTIVAYAMKDGKVNLSKGLEIDGHYVGWNTDAAIALTQPDAVLAEYSAGESAEPAVPATEIFLDGNAERMTLAGGGQRRLAATLKPYRLLDQRAGAAIGTLTTEEYSYMVVKIARQYWMAENLRTTRYASGVPIPTNQATADWSGAMSPGCLITLTPPDTGTRTGSQDANSTSAANLERRALYGISYNYHAVTNSTAAKDVEMPEASRTDRISPAGWSIPNRDQFRILCNYVFNTLSGVPSTTPVTIASTGHELSGYSSNETGFGAIGNNWRSDDGSTGSTTTSICHTTRYYLLDTYLYRSAQTTVNNQHVTSLIEIKTNAVSGPATNEVVWTSQNQSTQRSAYVRCLRNE